MNTSELLESLTRALLCGKWAAALSICDYLDEKESWHRFGKVALEHMELDLGMHLQGRSLDRKSCLIHGQRCESTARSGTWVWCGRWRRSAGSRTGTCSPATSPCTSVGHSPFPGTQGSHLNAGLLRALGRGGKALLG